MLINTPLQVLTAAPALHSLIVNYRDDVADILEFQKHKRVDLRKLSIDYRSIEVSTGVFANIVAVYPDLEGLSLEGLCEHKSYDYCCIAQLKKLSELNLSMCQVDYMYVQPYI